MSQAFSIVLGLLLAVLVVSAWRRRRRPNAARGEARPRPIGSIGPGAAGTFYEFLNEDKRKAIEIVVEERAGYTDPETRDGNLPQFEVRGVGPDGKVSARTKR